MPIAKMMLSDDKDNPHGQLTEEISAVIKKHLGHDADYLALVDRDERLPDGMPELISIIGASEPGKAIDMALQFAEALAMAFYSEKLKVEFVPMSSEDKGSKH